MGRDKARLRLSPSSPTFAAHAGRCLKEGVAPGPALEVGPGASGLPTAADLGVEDPRTGPLTAIVAGWEALGQTGFRGSVVVLATDLPLVTVEMVSFLARFGEGSVVPVIGGRMQPLAARWSEQALEIAQSLAAGGERSLQAVFGQAPDLTLVEETTWRDVAPAAAWSDVDEPADLEALAHRGHPSGPRRPTAPG